VTERWDAIVLGLGIMGSATACELARRGKRVLAIERFEPQHGRGSSHGESRIIRELIFEHPVYVPIVQRAYERWRDLEAQTGSKVLELPGCLVAGPSGGRVTQGAREVASQHGLPIEELSASALSARAPEFHLPSGHTALWDPNGGYLRADVALAACQTLAARHGAELHFRTRAKSWEIEEDRVTVESTQGTHIASHLILCTGPWMGEAVPDLQLPLLVERQVLVWFDPAQSFDRTAGYQFPSYIYEYSPGQTAYGFPRLSTGVKAAVFHNGLVYPFPELVERQITEDDLTATRDAFATLLPDLATAPIRGAATCLFTNTPDSRFIIDWHPRHRNVLVCSACSGHGFKFASAIGEINADLVTEGKSRFDLSPFSVERFRKGPA
jgi:sarcosine oxidase